MRGYLTVVSEIGSGRADHINSHDSRHILHFYSPSEHHSDGGSRKRVVYDGFFSSSGPSFSILLALEYFRGFGISPPRNLSQPAIPSQYELRIIPLVPPTAWRAPQLPSPAIRRIVNYIVNAAERGQWSKIILSYGLVSKSWSAALELLWVNAMLKGHPIHDISKAAQALSRRPGMGTFVQRFDIDEIKIGGMFLQQPVLFDSLRGALSTFFRHCFQLKELVIDHLTFIQNRELLKRLSQVEILHLSPKYYQNMGCSLTLSEIFEVASRWNLRRLYLSGWKDSTIPVTSSPQWVCLFNCHSDAKN
jgi:hypothetical protein